MSDDIPEYLKKQALDPKWDQAGRVHDWRNYVSPRVRAIWDTFTEEQKFALVHQADLEATSEEWE